MIKQAFYALTWAGFWMGGPRVMGQVNLLTNGNFNTLGSTPTAAANWSVGSLGHGQVTDGNFQTASGGTIPSPRVGQPALGHIALFDGGTSFSRQTVTFPSEGDYRITFDVSSLTNLLTPEFQPAKYVQHYVIKLNRAGSATPEIIGDGYTYTYQPWIQVSYAFHTGAGAAEFSIETDSVGGYVLLDNLVLSSDAGVTVADVPGKGAAAYEVRSIPPLLPVPANCNPSKIWMQINGINNLGDVCGTAHYEKSLPAPTDAIDEKRAFVYSFATQTVSALLGLGGTETEAYGINDAGDIVGSAAANIPVPIPAPILWRNRSPIALGIPNTGEANVICFATHINNTGDIIGAYVDNSLPLLWETTSGAFWHASGNLRTATYSLIPASGFSAFWALSDSHQIFGTGWYTKGTPLPFSYPEGGGGPDSTGLGLFQYGFSASGVATLLEPLRPTNQQIPVTFPNDIYAMNSANIVIGQGSDDRWDARAWTWNGSAYTYLPPLIPADVRPTSAYGINNNGKIVGSSIGEAVLWKTGSIVRLNKRLQTPQGNRFSRASAINDRGIIVARGPSSLLPSVGSNLPYETALLIPTTVARLQTIGNVLKLTYPTETGTTYQVQSSSDLNAWGVVSNLVGTGAEAQVTLPAASTTTSKQFFRVSTSF